LTFNPRVGAGERIRIEGAGKKYTDFFGGFNVMMFSFLNERTWLVSFLFFYKYFLKILGTAWDDLI
jgi:hypothetical protein